MRHYWHVLRKACDRKLNFAGPTTYLQVTTEKGPLWLAVYKTKVTKGTTVKYSNGVAMSGFYSKSLNRNFDVIVFVDTIEQVK